VSPAEHRHVGVVTNMKESIDLLAWFYNQRANGWNWESSKPTDRLPCIEKRSAAGAIAKDQGVTVKEARVHDWAWHLTDCVRIVTAKGALIR
jgi:hypothetical protein